MPYCPAFGSSSEHSVMNYFLRMALKIWLAVTVVILAGCAGGLQSFEYHAADDPPPGPGLFSGPDGAFTIYQDKGEEDAAEEEPSTQ